MNIDARRDFLKLFSHAREVGAAPPDEKPKLWAELNMLLSFLAFKKFHVVGACVCVEYLCGIFVWNICVEYLCGISVWNICVCV